MYLKNRYLILSILLILIIIFIGFFGHLLNINNIETFATDDILYVSDNMYNFKQSLNIDLNTFNNVLNNYKTKKELLLNTTKYNSLSLLIDPYVNYFYLNNTNNNNYENYNKNGIFLYITSSILVTDTCVWDIENKTVGYVFPSDYYFIQAFIKAYKIDINKVNLVQFSIDDLIKKELPEFDVLITYVIPDSEYMVIIEHLKYFINGFNDVDLDRLKAFYPFLKEKNDYIGNFLSKNMKGFISNVKTIIPEMNYVIIKNIPVISNIQETFITRLEMPEGYIEGKDYKNVNSSNLELISELYNDRNYGCYGNNIVNNKFECDSMYNIDGTGKNYYSVWDKKCNTDSDCPFYSKNYLSGGCLKDGFCELPIGVKRTGFMKYDDEGLNTPMCYNCEDTTDLECCKKNDGKIIAYAFPNEFDRRVERGLTPVIAPLKYII
uniref:Uncharacterized protein n=1 Tax=viral metagenome TaxID=1070528 RepID=A0A6C0J596_9ZZZZ